MRRIPLTIVTIASFAVASEAPAADPPPVRWTYQAGTTDWEYGDGIAVDGSGHCHITGPAGGSFPGPNPSSASDIFLLKLDTGGIPIWGKQFGSSSDDRAYDIAVDGAGSSFLTGITGGDLGGPNAGLYDAFLGKYDSAGNRQWIVQLGTPCTDESVGIALDGQGNSYIAGHTFGDIDGSNAGLSDVFVAKFDPNGAPLWARQAGTTQREEGRGLAVDAAGNSYVSGYTQAGLAGPHVDVNDAFLIKYDTDGDELWRAQLGTRYEDESNGVAVDASGNAYIGGHTRGDLDGSNRGGQDAFIARYDSDGSKLWVRQFGTSEDDRVHALAVDAAGNCLVTGRTLGSLGGPHAGNWDGFVAKYSAVGDALWILQFGTAETELSHDITVCGNGWPHVTGNTCGSLGGPHVLNADVFAMSIAPEPASMGLLAFGVLVLARLRRRRA